MSKSRFSFPRFFFRGIALGILAVPVAWAVDPTVRITAVPDIELPSPFVVGLGVALRDSSTKRITLVRIDDKKVFVRGAVDDFDDYVAGVLKGELRTEYGNPPAASTTEGLKALAVIARTYGKSNYRENMGLHKNLDGSPSGVDICNTEHHQVWFSKEQLTCSSLPIWASDPLISHGPGFGEQVTHE